MTDMDFARAQSQNIVYATLHDEVVVLRAEVERQRIVIDEQQEEIRRLDVDQVVSEWAAINQLMDDLEQANDCIERQLSDLETLRAAHDGTQ